MSGVSCIDLTGSLAAAPIRPEKPQMCQSQLGTQEEREQAPSKVTFADNTYTSAQRKVFECVHVAKAPVQKSK